MPFWSPDGAQLGFFAEASSSASTRAAGRRRRSARRRRRAAAPGGPTAGSSSRHRSATGLSIVRGERRRAAAAHDARRSRAARRAIAFRSSCPDGKSILFLAQTAEGGARNDESAHRGARPRERQAHAPDRRQLVAAVSPPPGRSCSGAKARCSPQRFDPERLAARAASRVRSPRRSPSPRTSRCSPRSRTRARWSIARASAEPSRRSSGSTATASACQVLVDRGCFDDFALSPRRQAPRYTNNSAGQGRHRSLGPRSSSAATRPRLTFEEGGDDYPVWSRDDRSSTTPTTARNDGTIFRRASDGSGAPEEIGTTAEGIWPLAASRDGQLARRSAAMAAGDGVRHAALRPRRPKQITPLVETPFHDAGGRALARRPPPRLRLRAVGALGGLRPGARGRQRPLADLDRRRAVARAGAPTAASSSSSPRPIG